MKSLPEEHERHLQFELRCMRYSAAATAAAAAGRRMSGTRKCIVHTVNTASWSSHNTAWQRAVTCSSSSSFYSTLRLLCTSTVRHILLLSDTQQLLTGDETLIFGFISATTLSVISLGNFLHLLQLQARETPLQFLI